MYMKIDEMIEFKFFEGANPRCVAASVLKLFKFFLRPTQLGHNMCVWMVRMPLKSSRGGTFFSKKHGFLGLTPVYSETTALSKPYFKLKLQSVRKFQQKRLFFKTQKVTETGYYYIEDPFPDLISKLRRFRGDTECGLLVIKSH